MKAVSEKPAPRILVVDDETRLLNALRRVLPRSWEIATESDPLEAVARMQREKDFSVVMTDYKMPHMNGLQLLKEAKRHLPQAIRLMLTGYADLETALAAVNDGLVFRILTKPCDRDTIVLGLRAAVVQYQLVQSERELLEETLKGTVELLVDLQALQTPDVCHLNNQLRSLSLEVAQILGARDIWAIEVAAILAHLGLFACPQNFARKYLTGQPLDKEERTTLEQIPQISARMVSHIPRLEPVAEIIALHRRHFDSPAAMGEERKGKSIPLGARILHAVNDYLRLEKSGAERSLCLYTLRHATGYYDPDVLTALESVVAQRTQTTAKPSQKRYLSLEELKAGMRLAEDLCSTDGLLLLPAGLEMQLNHLARMQNFARTIGVRTPVVVVQETLDRPHVKDEASVPVVLSS